MAELDPDLAVVLRKMEDGGWLPLCFDPPDAARAHYRKLSLVRRRDGYVPEPVARVGGRSIDGPAGPLGVRVYEPAPEASTVLVWLHGGGWVLGDLDTVDPICRAVANDCGCVVVSVDYRLAPEHPHPAPLDDAMAALRWAHAEWPGHALTVGGDSAGGGLAAGAALRARDEGGPPLAAQLLVYPGVDPAMDRPSIAANGTGYFLTEEDMRWFWDRYAPDDASRRDPLVNLLAAPDLTGLPPAVVTTAEYDPLHDEGVAYAARLREAGVDVTHVEGDGLIHGYFAMTDLSAASLRTAEVVQQAFARLLAT